MTNNALNEVEKVQANRLEVLQAAYRKVTNGKRPQAVSIFSATDLAPSVEIEPDEIADALQYLREEGFLKLFSPRGNNLTWSYVLTHEGLKEVEQVLLQPKSGTTHFPPQVAQTIIIQGDGGITQIGTGNVASIDNSGSDLSAVMETIEQLKRQTGELPEDDREDAEVALDLLDGELKGSRDPKKIRFSMNGLTRVAHGTVDFASKTATLFKQVKALELL